MSPIEQPRLSVVVPARNAGSTIRRQLRALLEQDAATDFEIIVADNGSADDTGRIAAMSDATGRVRIVDASETVGANFARNTAASTAKAPLLAFCDADDVVHRGWIDAMVAGLQEWDAVGGRWRVIRDGRLLSILDPSTVASHLPAPLGANCGVRRDAWKAVGGFDEDLVLGSDEHDFFFRVQYAGFRFGALENAIIDYNDDRGGPAAVFRRSFRRGIGNVELYVRHADHGMRRESAIDVMRSAAWVVRSAPMSLTDRETRREVARVAGRRAGRLAGSIRTGRLYP